MEKTTERTAAGGEMHSGDRELQKISTGLQAAVGLGLAAIILSAWIWLHVQAVFLVDWGSATNRWLIVPTVLLQCWLSVGLFIVAHDAMHGSLAPYRPRLNSLVGQICVGVYAGFSYRRLLRSHHDHHRYAGTAEDPDFDENHPSSFWLWYATFFREYFGWREFLVLSAGVAFYLIVLNADVGRLLAFWALPAVLSSVQLFYFGTYLPHRAKDGEVFQDNHNARSNEFGWVMSLLTCFHFGYHHEHHLNPAVPWWRLPETRGREIQGTD